MTDTHVVCAPFSLVGWCAMGSSTSRFRDAVARGDMSEAYGLYYSKKSIRDAVDPNAPIGGIYGDNTLMHYAALYAMKQLYVDLVNSGGRPDQKVVTVCW